MMMTPNDEDSASDDDRRSPPLPDGLPPSKANASIIQQKIPERAWANKKNPRALEKTAIFLQRHGFEVQKLDVVRPTRSTDGPMVLLSAESKRHFTLWKLDLPKSTRVRVRVWYKDAAGKTVIAPPIVRDDAVMTFEFPPGSTVKSAIVQPPGRLVRRNCASIQFELENGTRLLIDLYVG